MRMIQVICRILGLTRKLPREEGSQEAWHEGSGSRFLRQRASDRLDMAEFHVKPAATRATGFLAMGKDLDRLSEMSRLLVRSCLVTVEARKSSTLIVPPHCWQRLCLVAAITAEEQELSASP